MSTSANDLPVGVVVLLKVKDEAGLSSFIDDFQPLHSYVNAKETHAVLYELHHRENDPLSLVIMEKYQTERDLKEVHNSSEALHTFAASLKAATYVVDGSLEIIVTNTVDDDRLLGYGSPTGTRGDGVLVFCGARPGKNPDNVLAGTSMGEAIAKKGRTLVYGGGTVGIMGAVVNAVLANNGKIRSVIPRSMIAREVSGEMLGDVTYTHTMSQRKSVMFRHSSTVIALPGGLGTFDEVLEAITLLQLNAYRPKIGFLNVNGFFDPFFTFIRHLIAEGYVEEHIFDFFVVENSGSGEALLDKLDAYEVPPSCLNLTWTQPVPY